MAYWNGFVPGQSLPPATMPDRTAISLRNNLFPGQGVTLDGNWSLAEGAIALQRDAWTKSQQVMTQNAAIESHAKAKAEVAKARKADAEARKADAEASLAEAEVKEKIRAAKAEADARIRVAEAEEANKIRVDEAETTTKIRVQAAEAREADLKILKLGKEIDVFTGECEVKEYLCFLSVRPSLCLSLTACFSD
ncbi:hypothetical protein HKI87_04g32350 [Chloropicon roscoffensis]|uniref:Uncharacterized protein n=1 Tax=Chloropicon roscoffensis TaxID=1461544 RepID=A0AAX4P7Y7_9CHLO